MHGGLTIVYQYSKLPASLQFFAHQIQAQPRPPIRQDGVCINSGLLSGPPSRAAGHHPVVCKLRSEGLAPAVSARSIDRTFSCHMNCLTYHSPFCLQEVLARPRPPTQGGRRNPHGEIMLPLPQPHLPLFCRRHPGAAPRPPPPRRPLLPRPARPRHHRR